MPLATNDLNGLGAKLTVDDTNYLTKPFYGAAGIFYDAATDATYVGFYVRAYRGTVFILE